MSRRGNPLSCPSQGNHKSAPTLRRLHTAIAARMPGRRVDTAAPLRITCTLRGSLFWACAKPLDKFDTGSYWKCSDEGERGVASTAGRKLLSLPTATLHADLLVSVVSDCRGAGATSGEQKGAARVRADQLNVLGHAYGN